VWVKWGSNVTRVLLHGPASLPRTGTGCSLSFHVPSFRSASSAQKETSTQLCKRKIKAATLGFGDSCRVTYRQTRYQLQLNKHLKRSKLEHLHPQSQAAAQACLSEAVQTRKSWDIGTFDMEMEKFSFSYTSTPCPSLNPARHGIAQG
jgi:hypothetical protein